VIDDDDGQFDANKFIKSGAMASGQAGSVQSAHESIDKLCKLSATGNDALFAHARS